MTADPAMMAVSVSSDLAACAKTAALLGLVYLAGHAVLGLVLDTGRPRAGPFAAPSCSGFGALALGPAAVLICSSVLRFAGLYRASTTIASLVAVVLLGAVLSGSFRCQVARLRAQPFMLLAYAGCAIAVWSIFPPQTMPRMSGNSVYLMQGFDLFSTENPMVWPYFGEMFAMPVMYVTHTIGTFFGLFSTGNPAEYLIEGQYWLVIGLAPLAPIGLYIFLVGQVPRWLAIIVVFLFCFWTLGSRTWSIRGETLGWICGFAFLAIEQEVIELCASNAHRARAVRLAFAAGLAYVTLGITHGISATICTFLFSGLGIAALLGFPHKVRFVHVVAPTIAFGVSIAVASVVYLVLFCNIHNFHQIMFNNDQPPIVGEPDPALLVEQQFSPGSHTALRPIRGSAPYTSAIKMVEAAAILPVAAVFRPSLDRIALGGFPEDAYMRLASLPHWEVADYVGGFGLCVLGCLLLVLLHVPAPGLPLLISSIIVFVFSLAFIVYMDYQSFSIFPLASTRRLYPYIRFFYSLTLLLTAYEVGRWAYAFDKARPAEVVHLQGPPASRRRLRAFDAAAVLFSFCTVLFATMTAAADHPWDAGWFIQRVAATAFERVNDVIGISVPSRSSRGAFSDMIIDDQSAKTQAVSLLEAMDYVKNNSRPGEKVYSNQVSDNQFWYLTMGRVSLYEGSAMYQVFALQRRAAAHMVNFHAFAHDADVSRLTGYDVHLVVLYKHEQCVDGCYGYDIAPANLCAFNQDDQYRQVFENKDYIIFRLSLDPEHSDAADLNGKDCESIYKLSQTVRFTAAAENPYLGKGWSFPETAGTWTDDEVAQLRFHVRRPTSNLVMRATYSPYLPPGQPPPIVTVEIGGGKDAPATVVGRWTTSTAGVSTRCVLIPYQTVRRARDLLVSLKIEGPPSPADLHWTSDTRHLGIFMQSVVIEPEAPSDADCAAAGDPTAAAATPPAVGAGP